MCSLKVLSEMMYLPHQSQLKCVIIKGFYPEFVLKWWYFQIAGLNRRKVTSDVFFGFSPLWAFKCGLKLPAWINAKSHAVWPSVVCVQMSPQIACMNPCWLHLICLHYVFSNVSSLWEYFDLQGPWHKVLTDLKKSLYTLQADPEKSRDFTIKNPEIPWFKYKDKKQINVRVLFGKSCCH